MGYRVFRDSQGTEWQTWDVVPRLGERRVKQQRRRIAAPPPAAERRRKERRIVSAGRPILGGLQAGWLCFEATFEKRRLTPIPIDWEQCADRQLENYCRRASPARRRPRV